MCLIWLGITWGFLFKALQYHAQYDSLKEMPGLDKEKVEIAHIKLRRLDKQTKRKPESSGKWVWQYLCDLLVPDCRERVY